MFKWIKCKLGWHDWRGKMARNSPFLYCGRCNRLGMLVEDD